jgi:hypothetical protein
MKSAQIWLAFISSFFLLVVLVLKTSVLIASVGFMYLSVYFFVVCDLVKSSRMTFVMKLFLTFFAIGHVIKTGNVLLNKDMHVGVGWVTVGSFDYSTEMMSVLFFVELCTIVSAYFVFKFFLNRVNVSRDVHLDIKPGVKINYLMFIWAAVSALLIIFINSLGFGQHGMEPDPNNTLPYGIAGFLLYFRNLTIFSVGLALVELYLMSKNRQKSKIIFLLYILIAAIYSYYSLSRSAFIIITFPLIYYYLHGLKVSLISLLKSIAIFIALIVLVSLVNVYRLTIYSGVEINLIDLMSSESLPNIFDILSFVLDRIEGSRELMAVIASDVKGLLSFYETFYTGSDRVMESVMGFLPTADGRAFGMTYGLVGLLFISGSYLLVLFGTAFYVTFLLIFERLFIRRGYTLASMYISFVMFVNVWGNMTWFFFVRFLFIVLLTYFIINILVHRLIIFRHKRISSSIG